MTKVTVRTQNYQNSSNYLWTDLAVQVGQYHVVLAQELTQPPSNLYDLVTRTGASDSMPGIQVFKTRDTDGRTRIKPHYLSLFDVSQLGFSPHTMNLGIASTAPPDSDGGRLLASAVYGDPLRWRPALVVQIGGIKFASVHAHSPNGYDAPFLLEALSNLDGNWVAGGDFNRSLERMTFPANTSQADCGLTHNTKGRNGLVNKYDFFVFRDTYTVIKAGHDNEFTSSDHKAAMVELDIP